jgi:flagellar biosynthesis protein FliQ
MNNTQFVLTLGQQAMQVTLLISAPLLLTALVVGLVVSIFQAATQINEMTLSFIPKLLAMFAVLVIAGPWMLTTMLDFMRRLFESIPFVIS